MEKGVAALWQYPFLLTLFFFSISILHVPLDTSLTRTDYQWHNLCTGLTPPQHGSMPWLNTTGAGGCSLGRSKKGIATHFQSLVCLQPKKYSVLLQALRYQRKTDSLKISPGTAVKINPLRSPEIAVMLCTFPGGPWCIGWMGETAGQQSLF